MHTLFSNTAYPPYIGGTQLHMHLLAQELSHKHTLKVVTHWDKNRTDWLLGATIFSPGEEKKYVIDGIPVTRLGFSWLEKLYLAPWAGIYPFLQGLSVQQISALIEKKIMPLAADAELVHNWRVGREGLSYASFKVARKKNIPFFITPVHHPRNSSWFHRLYKALYQQADGVIAMTPTEKETLINMGVKGDKIFVTGIGPVLAEKASAENFREKFHFGSDPVILFLGRKYPYKGVAVLLEAAESVWKRIPDARFLFIGPPTSYSEKLFSGVKDARITEMGSIDLQTKTDALSACTLLCMPSNQESFGGVYTEGWWFGKPVIGGDIPAIQDVISDGVDGYCVKQDPQAIAEKIIYLLENPSAAEKMGAAGREKVLNQYAWSKTSQNIENAYRCILSGRSG